MTLPDVLPAVVWGLSAAYSFWRLLVLFSISGKVDNEDRFLMVLTLIIPPVAALAIFLVESALAWEESNIKKRWTVWKIERKIRRKWKGPLTRLVEHMHKQRKDNEKENGETQVEDVGTSS